MTKLLKENCLLEKQQLVKEGNKVKVQGIFQRADAPNKNGRVYPRALWENVLKRKDVLESINGRNMLGELDHPDITETSLKNVSHLITKLELKPNGEVIGEAEILDTPNGLILQKLIEAGVKVGISSRGYVPEDSGAKRDSKGNYIVPESFVLKTFDFVVDPSTPGAFPDVISENTKHEIMSLVESAGNTVSEHVKMVCESLNTTLEKEEEDSVEYADLLEKYNLLLAECKAKDATIQARDNTVAAIEGSYRQIYQENANLKAQLQGSGADPEGVQSQLEEANETIERLELRLEESEGAVAEAKEIIEGLLETNEQYEGLLEGVLNKSQQQLDVAVGVIENIRDRYLKAEAMLEEQSEDLQMMEASMRNSKAKLAVYESREEIEEFVVEKAKTMGVNESVLRDAVKGCTNLNEARETVLDKSAHLQRLSRTLPLGNVGAVNEGATAKQDNRKTPMNKLASAISRVQ